uniref:Uncharacterized protein n=1 Tax=Pithovirus LCDPAC01 TaxID=2506600 RepID=A0A481YPJ3_9VIRU|nr:MAG: hypothetical protein LCDPAC01_01930 [Pithovirus LCDPAC01]
MTMYGYMTISSDRKHSKWKNILVWEIPEKHYIVFSKDNVVITRCDIDFLNPIIINNNSKIGMFKSVDGGEDLKVNKIKLGVTWSLKLNNNMPGIPVKNSKNGLCYHPRTRKFSNDGNGTGWYDIKPSSISPLEVLSSFNALLRII